MEPGLTERHTGRPQLLLVTQALTAAAALASAAFAFATIAKCPPTPLGIWLAAARPVRGHDPVRPARRIPPPVLVGLATVTGCVDGIAGSYLGARMQSRLPDTLIRRTVGILAIAIAAQFLRSGLA